MRVLPWLMMTGALFAVAPPYTKDKDLRAVIDKAVAAVGGADKVGKFTAATWKGSGTLHGSIAVPYTLVGARQGAERFAVSVRGEANGMTFARDLVLNGNKGWVKLNGKLRELSADELAEEKERAWANWVATLVPLLTDKALVLSTAPPAKVPGREVVGVKVSSRGRRDVLLYFDKKSGELALKQTVVIDVLAGGKKIKEEVFFADYKPAPGGTKHATRVRVLWDGRLVSEAEVREITPKEKLGEKVFAAP